MTTTMVTGDEDDYDGNDDGTTGDGVDDDGNDDDDGNNDDNGDGDCNDNDAVQDTTTMTMVTGNDDNDVNDGGTPREVAAAGSGGVRQRWRSLPHPRPTGGSGMQRSLHLSVHSLNPKLNLVPLVGWGAMLKPTCSLPPSSNSTTFTSWSPGTSIIW